MNRGDKLEGQIRAVLAADASTRRVVAVHARPAVGVRIMRTALSLSAVVFLIVGALALGSAVRLLRSSPVASEPQATTQAAAVGVCAAARQRVLGMSSVITRLDRIEVKRMTVQDLDAGRDAQAPGATRPAGSLPSYTVLCVVAVGGEIRQTMGLIDTGPSSWSLFVSTAGADDPIISTWSGGNGSWPPYFDALPNRQPNVYPGNVVEAVGPDTLRVRLESAVLSAEYGNPVLVQANKYTEIVPTAPTVAATGVKPGDRVGVFFERQGRDISSGAYPLSIFHLTASPTPSASGGPRTETPALLLDVRTGAGADQPGVSPGVDVSTARGPTSLAVDEQGRIFLWDQANSRVLVYDRGNLTKAIPVTLPSDARELEVLNGKLYFASGTGAARREWELDASTGALLRTIPPPLTGRQSTLYPTVRTVSPIPVAGPIGTDKYGNRYERFVDPVCGRGAVSCVEIRRLSPTGTLLAAATEALADVADYYVGRDGAVYELRNDRGPGNVLAGVFVVRLMSALPVPVGKVRLDGQVRDYDRMRAANPPVIPNDGDPPGSALVAGAVVRLEPYGVETRTAADGTFALPPVDVPGPCRWVTVTVTKPGFGAYRIEFALYSPDIGEHLQLWLEHHDVDNHIGPPQAGANLGEAYCVR